MTDAQDVNLTVEGVHGAEALGAPAPAVPETLPAWWHRHEAALMQAEVAAEAAAALTQQEGELRETRDLVRASLIGGLIGAENPATGKPHSEASATRAIELDPQVRTLEAQIAQVVFKRARAAVARDLAFARAEAIRLNARLEIASLGIGEG